MGSAIASRGQVEYGVECGVECGVEYGVECGGRVWVGAHTSMCVCVSLVLLGLFHQLNFCVYIFYLGILKVYIKCLILLSY